MNAAALAAPALQIGPIVLTTGGTGGHIFPAEALARNCSAAASRSLWSQIVAARSSAAR